MSTTTRRALACLGGALAASAAMPPGATASEAGEDRFLPFEGARLHYRSHGTGPEAVVFIHGWTCDLSLWKGQAPVYSRRRSLLVDLPGHGRSEAPPETDYTQELFARAVEAVMRDAGVTRATLVGHSLGGPVAITALRLFPDKIHALVLVDSFLRLPQDYLNLQEKKQRAAALAGKAGHDAFAASLEGFFTSRTSPEARAAIRRVMLATPEHVRISATCSPAIPPPFRATEQYAVPLHHIQVARREVSAEWARIFPQHEVEKWEDHGHFLFMEDPARFNASLEGVLR
jgi:pimeloyl-ACP methyl ester carboxylesterase